MSYVNLINLGFEEYKIKEPSKEACFFKQYAFMKGQISFASHVNITISIEHDGEKLKLNDLISVDEAMTYLYALQNKMSSSIKKIVLDDKYIRVMVGFAGPSHYSDSEIEFFKIEYTLTLMLIRALYENMYSVAIKNALIAYNEVESKIMGIGLMEWAMFFSRGHFMLDIFHSPRTPNDSPVYFDVSQIKSFTKPYNELINKMTKIPEEKIAEMEKAISKLEFYTTKTQKNKFKKLFIKDC